MISATSAVQQILEAAGQPLPAPGDLTISGQDPVLPTEFLLGSAGAAVIAAVGLAAADLWEARTGRRQRVGIDLRAAGAALRSGAFLRIEGKPSGSPWGTISGFYQTRDERWIQYHCNYPHHRDGVLRLLGCDESREAVQAATLKWDAQAVEDALAEAGMCAGLVRTGQEWESHPQAEAVEKLPLLEIVKLGDSAPETLGEGSRPLAGVRVLDLSRVLAGPTGSRTLAEHGADVLRITAAHLPAQPDVDVDTGHGKLAAQLDLRDDGDRTRLLSLIRSGDVFLQAYRPGTLADRGLSPEELATVRPGIIYVTLSAYGHRGPWRDRRGFDSLVQSVSGIVHEQSRGGAPRHLPAQALDYCSGYLLAFGAMVALLRRAKEGGSYLVRVSLAQTGKWIWDLGRKAADRNAVPTRELRFEEADDLLVEGDSPFGKLRFLGPVVKMSETPAMWSRPAVPLAYHEPAWPS